MRGCSKETTSERVLTKKVDCVWCCDELHYPLHGIHCLHSFINGIDYQLP